MTFKKHLRSVSRAVSQRLGILRKSLRVFHDRSLLGRCFLGLSCQFWNIVLQSGARLPIQTLNYWTKQSMLPSNWGLCLSVTFFIVDPWQSCFCFIRSGVTRCTLLTVLYLDRICQCWLHAVPWSHIGTFMHRLAGEPCSSAGLLFPLGVL